MKFSERMGFKSSLKQMQIDSMDDDLRIGLWNCYFKECLGFIAGPTEFGNCDSVNSYIAYLWHHHFKYAIDQRHQNWRKNVDFIRDYFFKTEWFNVYEFLELHLDMNFIMQIGYPFHFFLTEINKVLEREFSGFRLIDNKFIPISNSLEQEEIVAASSIKKSIFTTNNQGVNFHLNEALSKLSDKKNPDYRTSIKDSISAVESLCRELTGESTLGKALKQLGKNGIVINQQIESSINNLYAYTNAKDNGIRHALVESPNLPTFHEAKFILVTCSAFINYLIAQRQ